VTECKAHDHTDRYRNQYEDYKGHRPVKGLHDGEVVITCAWCGKDLLEQVYWDVLDNLVDHEFLDPSTSLTVPPDAS
jgi:hypothetical protein